jgi:hypothetical protein
MITGFRRKAVMLLGLISAALTSACSNVSYMPNASLRESEVVALHQEDALKAPQKFGALRLVHPTMTDAYGRPAERLFLLKRTGKSYMAETLLFDHSGEPNAMFEKSFFAFGTNRDSRSVGFTLRFVY